MIIKIVLTNAIAGLELLKLNEHWLRNKPIGSYSQPILS